MSEAPGPDHELVSVPSAEKVATELVRIRRALRRLAVVNALLCLAVFLLAATVYGYLVNYFSFDPLLIGGVGAGAAVLGFLVGLFVGRR